MRLFAILILLLVSSMAQSASIEFYVAVNGSDKNPGTKGKPFATLERARDAVRVAKRNGGFSASPLTVWIRGGVYHIEKTFALTAEDSGTAYAPITYRAFDAEDVRLVGGVQVKDFKPATDDRLPEEARGHVLQADLRAQGITDYGKLTPRGFGRPTTPAHMELFFDDKPMTLAGWPNNDWAMIADVPAGPNGGKFTYEGDRPERWTKADDIWLHGYWTWPWAESHEKVAKIDTQTKEIYTEPPHGSYGYQAHKRWRALNLLEELDMPGEYYVDRKTGILYFWPPSDVKRGRAVVSVIEQPMTSLKDVSYITIRGLTIEACRGTAVVMEGGSNDLIAGCTLRNIGNSAVRIKGGTNNGVRSCDLHDMGDSGIVLDAGDRTTLTPAGDFVENCRIYRVSGWDRTYNPGILLSGVGNHIAHNEIYDLPHTAILFSGNDHIMEFNDLHNCCNETGDAGTIYTGRDFSCWGNAIRFNYIHDIGSYNDKYSGHSFSETMGVYLDDDASGSRVYGNVLYNVTRAILIGGGRSNTVQNNLIVGCKIGLHLDDRGLTWAKPTVDGFMKERLEAMPYRQSPWKERYPELLTIYDDEPGAPKYNLIEHNICFGGTWHNMSDKTLALQTMNGNMIDTDPGFVDYYRGDFRLSDDSPAYRLGFKRIPMEEIGLQKDEYRKDVVPQDVGEGVELPPPVTGEGVQLPPQHPGPKIRKLGTTVCDLVEATPVVFKGKLYRFEYVRDQYYKPNLGKPSYFRFVDVKTGDPTPAFAQGYHLGSAFVDGDTAYAFGVNKWDGEEIRVFWSKDLKTWESKTALDLKGWGIFNTAVCKATNAVILSGAKDLSASGGQILRSAQDDKAAQDDKREDRYIMAFEIGRPAEETGVAFTMRFAESKDLREWKLTPQECVYSKERYTACPAIRYVEGWYYMVYLEAYPGPTYNPCVVRSKDLLKWESSPLNPIMHYSIEDKLIAYPKLTQEECERIAGAVNINNSDVDFCEFEGKTVIVYSWGNQQGIEHLAEAVYDGPESEFLKSFFPEK